MSPNLEEQQPSSPDIETRRDDVQLTLTPMSDLSASTSLSEASQPEINSLSELVVENIADDDVDVAAANTSFIPLEQNIRDLLVRISDTENLETVTQIKLRVIASELALQQVGFYLPALRELILDGSFISSFRDLGYGLRNLKILKVNRCQLPFIDGVLGFESLEELYAADNSIKDLSPCAFLSCLRLLDIRRNTLKHLRSVSFLNLCPDLDEIFVEGNEFTERYPDYLRILGAMLENLSKIDGEPLLREFYGESDPRGMTEILIESSSDNDEEAASPILSRRDAFSPTQPSRLHQRSFRNIESSRGFIVRFPPRVFSSRSRGGE